MLVKTFGSAVHGISATTVTVEVNISQGINFFLVGLPDSAVKESHQRIDAALKNNDLKIPGTTGWVGAGAIAPSEGIPFASCGAGRDPSG